MTLSFILVENAEIDIYIAKSLIKMVAGEVYTETFFTVEEALNYITGDRDHEADQNVILLDLMMPKMNGADFISVFEELPDQVRENYRIVIVTSTMDKAELQRLSQRSDVEMIIEKPLTRDKFVSLMAQMAISTTNGEA